MITSNGVVSRPSSDKTPQPKWSDAPDRPDLSIIIVTYACRDLVLACLSSLRAQADDLRLEVIVVDNDSPDGTLEAVRELHPWVGAFAAGGNFGFSRANNLGLLRATGHTVLLLNPDTLVPRGTLRACVQALDERPAVGMLGCALVQTDGTLDHSCKRGFPTAANALWYFSGMATLWPMSPRFAAYTAGQVGDDEVSEVDAVSGAFMLVRREALEAVGGLDERYWMYGEDLDWCRRFSQAGWSVLYWPRVAVTHVKGGSSSKTRAWNTNKAFHRAMWIFYGQHDARHRPRAEVALVWTAIHLKLLASGSRSWVLRRRTEVPS